MTMNVQGAAATPWPDPTLQAAAAATAVQPAFDPTRAVQPHAAAHHQATRKVEAPAASSPYDAMRLQAYRRDAAQTAGSVTQAAPTSATASTESAPAVKSSQTPLVNPLAAVPQAPVARIEEPEAAPAITAPAGIGEL
jgi:hypothetical protein